MYKLNHDYSGGATVVPTELIDKHLKLAPSASFKVLLYILRNPKAAEDEAQIALCCGLSKGDALDSLEYWLRAGVLVNDGEKADDGENLKAVANARAVQTAPIMHAENTRTLPKAKAPTQSEVAKRLAQVPELAEICREAQGIFGTFGYDTQATIVMLYDHYGMPPEVILTLLQLQKDCGNTSSSAILKRAAKWNELGIDSLELVQAELSALESVEKCYTEIMAFAGLTNPKPTPSVEKKLRVWVCDWEFGSDMIMLALDESGKSFSQADKLLYKWQQAGLKTPDDVNLKKSKTVSTKIEKSYQTDKIGKNSVLEWMKKYSENPDESEV